MLLPMVFGIGSLVAAAIVIWGGYAEERRNGEAGAPNVTTAAPGGTAV